MSAGAAFFAAKAKKKKKKPLSFKHVFDEELKIINFIKSTLENTSV